MDDFGNDIYDMILAMNKGSGAMLALCRFLIDGNSTKLAAFEFADWELRFYGLIV